MIRLHTHRLLLALLLTALGQRTALAELQLSPLFSDHMVMQRSMSVPVWGWAEPNENITVTLGQQSKTATADATGKWLVRLDALEPGSPRTMTVAGKSQSKMVSDILVGEVWVCGGQSNMEWPLSTALNAESEIAAADYPQLRLFQLANGTTPDGPTDRIESNLKYKAIWEPCTPATAKGFSAAAYFFGRDLQKQLNVPIGLIFNAVGASYIEAWISRDKLLADADAKFLVARADRIVKYSESSPGKEELAEVLAEYDVRQKEARAKGGWYWRSDDWQEPRKQLRYPGTFFNGRVNPLIPYAIRGVIWYQGEANWSMGHAYRNLMRLLIEDWRAHWGQGDFPFLYVQLANFGPAAVKPEPAGWAELRESQLTALQLPHTGMAVAIDIGDARDIHPKNKQDVGQRLALAARGVAYHEPVVFSGPIYRAMQVEGDSIRLQFDHVGSGLVARDGALQQFSVAGTDQKFVWATARIDGDSVLVHSDAVSQPVAVRYAWASNPAGCNLYNREGLPASPFRTDTWPGVTTSKTYESELDKPISLKLKR